MRGLFVRIAVASSLFLAFWAVSASQLQAQYTRLGNMSAGSAPVSITVPSSLSRWRPIAYKVDGQTQPRQSAGQTRTFTPTAGVGIRVDFHNGSPSGREVHYRLYGGSYSFGERSRTLYLYRTGGPPASGPEPSRSRIGYDNSAPKNDYRGGVPTNPNDSRLPPGSDVREGVPYDRNDSRLPPGANVRGGQPYDRNDSRVPPGANIREGVPYDRNDSRVPPGYDIRGGVPTNPNDSRVPPGYDIRGGRPVNPGESRVPPGYDIRGGRPRSPRGTIYTPVVPPRRPPSRYLP